MTAQLHRRRRVRLARRFDAAAHARDRGEAQAERFCDEATWLAEGSELRYASAHVGADAPHRHGARPKRRRTDGRGQAAKNMDATAWPEGQTPHW